MKTTPVPWPPYMNRSMKNHCSSNQQFFMTSPLTEFMKRQEEMNVLISETLGKLQETGDRLRSEMKSVEDKMITGFSDINQLYTKQEQSICNVKNQLQIGLKNWDTLQKKFKDRHEKIWNFLLNIERKLTGLEEEQKSSITEQLKSLSNTILTLFNTLTAQNEVFQKELQKIDHVLEMAKQDHQMLENQMSHLADHLHEAKQEVLQILNELLRSKVALKTVLALLPSNYPLNAISVGHSMISVDRFVFFDQKKNIIHFLQGSDTITVDADSITAIHFRQNP